ncbi:MAG: ABC transporter permease [Candidatus Methylacidiphilales bacterium]|nr:ABC transporter permease [Candidatus Methylacidiphilales bacterium]
MDWKRYWNIILYRAYAEIKAEAQINYMGYVWWFLEPLVNTILFYAILILVMQQSNVGAVSFLLVGTIVWQWFSASVVSSSQSIFEASMMLKLVYLPKIVLPLISILAGIWRFMFLFGLLLLWCFFSGNPPNIHYLALPCLFVTQLILILGFSLPVAALIPYFPDGRFAVDAVLRSIMLVSGIFFSADQVPVQYHSLLYLNPMAVLVESYRSILLHDSWPNFLRLGWACAFGLLLVVGSFSIYRKIDRSIVKSIHR